MESILKKLNGKWILLFLCMFFSVGAQAQWDENKLNFSYDYQDPTPDVESVNELEMRGLVDFGFSGIDYVNVDFSTSYDSFYSYNSDDQYNSSNWTYDFGYNDDSFDWYNYGFGDNYYNDNYYNDNYYYDDYYYNNGQYPDYSLRTDFIPISPDFPCSGVIICPKYQKADYSICGCKRIPRPWYLDRDGDGWHGEVINAVDSPGLNWKKETLGKDCDDAIFSSLNNCGDAPCEISADDVYNAFGGKRSIIDPMISIINKYAKFLGINSKVELQHFLAQAAFESKNFTSTEEGTKYQTTAVMANFGKFFNGIGNENKNPNLKNLSDFGTTRTTSGKIYVKDREALFNYIYNDQNRIRVGYSPLGNTQSGDGFKFIGRGIIQITGRDNYTAFNNWYKKNINQNADLVNDPKLLDTNKEIGTLASLWYFKERVIDRIYRGIDNNTTANQVTIKINSKMLEKDKRAANFRAAKAKINCKN